MQAKAGEVLPNGLIWFLTPVSADDESLCMDDYGFEISDGDAHMHCAGEQQSLPAGWLRS